MRVMGTQGREYVKSGKRALWWKAEKTDGETGWNGKILTVGATLNLKVQNEKFLQSQSNLCS